MTVPVPVELPGGHPQSRGLTAVAATLHFGRAAEKLHVVPAAVTQRVRDLERELDLPLFRRTSRTVALTSGGAALLAPAMAALAAVAEVAQTARSLASGTTGRVAIGLAPNAGRFAAQLIVDIGDGLPGVEVTARSLFAGEGMAALDAGEIQAAVICKSGLLEVNRETVTTFSLEQANDAVARAAERGRPFQRTVFTANQL